MRKSAVPFIDKFLDGKPFFRAVVVKYVCLVMAVYKANIILLRE